MSPKELEVGAPFTGLPLAGPREVSQTTQIDEKLTVEWHEKDVRIETRQITRPDGSKADIQVTVLHFSKGVRAIYGPTILTANELELRLDEVDRTGYAKGTVHLDDPDGTIDAAELSFQWREGTGNAKDAKVRIDSLEIRAGEISIAPERWVLTDAYLDPNAGGANVYSLSSSRVEIRPGQKLIARSFGIHLFGKQVVVIPRMTYSLRKGSKGLRLPTPGLKSGGRPSVSWDADYLVGNRLLFSGAFDVVHERKPTANAAITYDLLGPRSESEFYAPRSDLSDPLPYGYFDNVGVRTPARERHATGNLHETISLEGSTNQRVIGRGVNSFASEPWSLVYDRGDTTAGFAHNLQLRYQQVEEKPGNSVHRGEAMFSVMLPSVKLTNGLHTLARVDARYFAQPGGAFSWSRIEAGLTYQPIEWMRVGAAYAIAGENGKPAFQFDRPFPMHSLNLRADAQVGPRTLSYLAKFDPVRSKWYDREIAFRQVAGSLSPYIVWRQFPRRFAVGLELRTLDIIDQLKERFRRPSKHD